MESVFLQVPAYPPASPPKSWVKLPVKRLDPGLREILRKRKSDAGILPGLPFH
jgi:hypothetical protein